MRVERRESIQPVREQNDRPLLLATCDVFLLSFSSSSSSSSLFDFSSFQRSVGHGLRLDEPEVLEEHGDGERAVLHAREQSAHLLVVVREMAGDHRRRQFGRGHLVAGDRRRGQRHRGRRREVTRKGRVPRAADAMSLSIIRPSTSTSTFIIITSNVMCLGAVLVIVVIGFFSFLQVRGGGGDRGGLGFGEFEMGEADGVRTREGWEAEEREQGEEERGEEEKGPEEDVEGSGDGRSDGVEVEECVASCKR